ncbi:DUF1835 domain-containing protein [Leptospira kirschneri]|uniref:PF12395 family protein n=1 Tax=Leptospira kirschneri serovar Bulgarica str. Nikolaevo TaxID=1240687 RepID=M6FA25_9LEPT|nr:DUF1835 domain-containing protein [Leptospira kirschneri]EMK23882.1 PF12395 family protein [Leptospira kirschneri serovar Bulgarica str. Nikolaevo]
MKKTEYSEIQISFSETTTYDLKRLNQKVTTFCWDDLSIGPIYQINTEVGQQKRQQWLFKNISSDYYKEEDYFSDFTQCLKEIDSIPKDLPMTIWKGDCAGDHLGFCFILSLLEGQNQIRVIHASKVYKELFHKEYEVFRTGQLSLEEISKIYEKSKEIPFLTDLEKTDLKKEWEKFLNSINLLRIRKGDRVVSAEENHLDSFIIECAKKLDAQNSFCDAIRLIGTALGNYEQLIQDRFWEYRLRVLITQGIFKMEGSLESYFTYKVKLVIG